MEKKSIYLFGGIGVVVLGIAIFVAVKGKNKSDVNKMAAQLTPAQKAAYDKQSTKLSSSAKKHLLKGLLSKASNKGVLAKGINLGAQVADVNAQNQQQQQPTS